METPSSIVAWKTPRAEEPSGLQSMGPTESDVTEWVLPAYRVEVADQLPAICHREYSLFLFSLQYHTLGEKGEASTSVKHPIHLLNLGPLPGFLPGN